MPEIIKVVLITFAISSVLGSVFVVIDKYNAKNNLYRISENTLMFFGTLGGAFSMYVAMKKCRHKTKKPKFMVSFPIMIILQIVLLLYLCYKCL